jgi:thiol:disulfide interchange protein DsbD
MKKLLFFLSIVAWSSMSLVAQIHNPVKWKFSVKQVSSDTYEVRADASIEKGWHLYSAYLPENGPIPTTLSLAPSDGFELVGKVVENPKPGIHYDSSFDMNLGYFELKAALTQVIKVKKHGSIEVKGEVEFMVCDDEQCLPPTTEEFNLNIKAAAPSEAQELTASEQPTAKLPVASDSQVLSATDSVSIISSESASLSSSQSTQPEEERSNWTLFWLSFLAGFAALLTPCVFPMIPMTVSFFTKQSKNRAAGVRNAVLFGISIIIIYVLLGTVVTAVFGADALNALSTDPWFNLFFFLLLIVFAMSFFGAFEIVLPSSWVNAADRNADKGGIIGIFFMAFTLALVSFSCTGPLVGTLIVQAARVGGMAPVIGMLGFSLALAIPFAFFAAFPGYLNSLPKSGGWLNSVKVVLGFLELAFAFKFLSVADMVLDLHLLEREVFIALWIVIFGALGFYLLGKLKLPHDSPMEHIPVSRFMLALATLGFTIYMIPGLWGAPVNLISGFPPPKEYAESPFGVGNDGPGNTHSVTGTTNGITAGSLPDHMHYGPQGIPAFDDYQLALDYARKVNKPLLLDFTGKGCVNCRKMEDKVWSNNTVKQMLSNDFVLVSLYVDLRTELPAEQQYVSEVTGKKIKTIGNKWSDFQMARYHRNSQPHYVIIDLNENELLPSMAYDPDVTRYLSWLNQGLAAFKAN